VVRGDGGDNEIEIKESHNKINVYFAGEFIRRFERRDVDKVEVYGLDGADEIVVHDSVSVVAWLFGGGENDSLTGGRRDTLIDGGDGRDTIRGGRGQNVLLGGRGGDLIFGEEAEDLIVGGGPIADADALSEVFRKWTGRARMKIGSSVYPNCSRITPLKKTTRSTLCSAGKDAIGT
jgi:Ca2+-binding RTX toxin-like protein